MNCKRLTGRLYSTSTRGVAVKCMCQQWKLNTYISPLFRPLAQPARMLFQLEQKKTIQTSRNRLSYPKGSLIPFNISFICPIHIEYPRHVLCTVSFPFPCPCPGPGRCCAFISFGERQCSAPMPSLKVPQHPVINL